MRLSNARKQMGAPAGHVTGLVNQRLLLQNEYLAAEHPAISLPCPYAPFRSREIHSR